MSHYNRRGRGQDHRNNQHSNSPDPGNNDGQYNPANPRRGRGGGRGQTSYAHLPPSNLDQNPPYSRQFYQQKPGFGANPQQDRSGFYPVGMGRGPSNQYGGIGGGFGKGNNPRNQPTTGQYQGFQPRSTNEGAGGFGNRQQQGTGFGGKPQSRGQDGFQGGNQPGFYMNASPHVGGTQGRASGFSPVPPTQSSPQPMFQGVGNQPQTRTGAQGFGQFYQGQSQAKVPGFGFQPSTSPIQDVTMSDLPGQQPVASGFSMQPPQSSFQASGSTKAVSGFSAVPPQSSGSSYFGQNDGFRQSGNMGNSSYPAAGPEPAISNGPQKRASYFSEDAELDDQSKSVYRRKKFKLGDIPLKPPTEKLCFLTEGELT